MKVFILSGILIILSSFSYAQQSQPDNVTVTFEVVVPESTPENATIFWTGSPNNWDPGNKGSGFSAKELAKPLSLKKDVWRIKLSSTKGDSVDYKFTRGTIFSVEEKPDFTYRLARSVVFDEAKTVRDTVAAWHDRPPESLEDQWPTITLSEEQKDMSYKGRPFKGFSPILYDKKRRSKFDDIHTYNTKIEGILESIGEHVFYFQKVSDAPDNTIMVMAGKISKNASWNVYVDQDNNNRIDWAEQVFTVTSDSIKYTWNGPVEFQVMNNGSSITDTINLKITHAANLPAGYSSSNNPEAPDLSSLTPFKQRKGTLNGNQFYLSTPMGWNFSKFFRLAVDRNRNDTLEVGSGSNEISAIDFGPMYRQQKYYIHPTFQLGNKFWEVANIDAKGTSIRLRPAKNAKTKANITKGKAAPNWKATTVEGKKISLSSLQGKYVLLDFWGSWCGPCIQEIPLLKKVYEQFKSDNFEIVGFAYESKTSLSRALKNYDLPWLHVLDNKGGYASTFLVRGYPTHYLIGPNGKVLERGYSLRDEELIPTLEKYLK